MLCFAFSPTVSMTSIRLDKHCIFWTYYVYILYYFLFTPYDIAMLFPHWEP